ncbi:MAG: cobalamin-dependent protein [Deltaproteobacteria bacterium]|nr:cobalamin-dependent protein [Deltaproteobacteria bacterium]
MRLLLIQPPIEDFYDTQIRLQPLGLAYLKAAVKKHVRDVQVRIIDFHKGFGKHTIPIPDELKYLGEYYEHADQSPFCVFHQYYRFGADDHTITKHVSEYRPDIVGISCLFTPYYREALKTAAAVKRGCDCPVIVGGSHVSAAPDSVLLHPAVDYVICGEGEGPLVLFLQSWFYATSFDPALIPGLGYKKQGKQILNARDHSANTHDHLIPDLSDFTPDQYQYQGKPMAFVMTSRGCPYHCSFCSVHATFQKFRQRSVENIIAEIRQRHQEGYRVIDFEDDNLTVDKNRCTALLTALTEEFGEWGMQYLAMNGLSYRDLDLDILVAMKKAGFTHLNIALVSANEAVLKSVSRPHRIGQYIEVVKEAHRLGLKILSSQILGFPSESLESIIDSLVMAARLPVLIGASPLYVIPGTPLAQEINLPPTPRNMVRARLTAMGHETESLKRTDIFTLFIATRMIDFVKSLPDLAGASSINQLIAHRDSAIFSEREKIGLSLLLQWINTGVLYASTSKGLKVIKQFDKGLLKKIWDSLDHVVTCSGGQVLI